MNNQFLMIQMLLCLLCKLDTAVSTIFSDIIIVWIFATLLFTNLLNVHLFGAI